MRRQIVGSVVAASLFSVRMMLLAAAVVIERLGGQPAQKERAK